MAFNWTYPADNETIIRKEPLEEVRQKLDSLDNFINCPSNYIAYNNNDVATFFSTKDVSYDSAQDITIDGYKNISVYASNDVDYNTTDNSTIKSLNFFTVHNPYDSTANNAN